MATNKAETAQRVADHKDRAQAISLGELRVRNLRDQYQIAQDKVREWAARQAKDPSLEGYDLDAYEVDMLAQGEAFANWTRATVETARLRMNERAELNDYAQNQGRE